MGYTQNSSCPVYRVVPNILANILDYRVVPNILANILDYRIVPNGLDLTLSVSQSTNLK